MSTFLIGILLGSDISDHFGYSVWNVPRKVEKSCAIWSSDGSFESRRAPLSKTPLNAKWAIFRQKTQPSQTRPSIWMLCILGFIVKCIVILVNIKSVFGFEESAFLTYFSRSDFRRSSFALTEDTRSTQIMSLLRKIRDRQTSFMGI